MNAWIEELSTGLLRSPDADAAFALVLNSARKLGFDYCAYGLRLPLPVSKPRVFLLNNYLPEWGRQYEDAGYLAIDPTVLHGRRSQAPIVWTDALFANAREMWDAARSFGLTVGWAQSSFDANGVVGMLTLARSGEAMTESELRDGEPNMRYLVSASHYALSRALSSDMHEGPAVLLTARETEILKWLADGMTSKEVSDLLHISFDTVNFHVKNAITKLGAANKTGAVARAILLGLLG